MEHCGSLTRIHETPTFLSIAFRNGSDLQSSEAGVS